MLLRYIALPTQSVRALQNGGADAFPKGGFRTGMACRAGTA